MKRIALAFLLAPFPAALIQSIVVAVWPKPGMGVFQHPLSMFITICLLFYLVEIALGVPLHLAVGRRGSRTMLSYGVAGTLLVLLPVSVGLAIAVFRGQLSAYIVGYDVLYFAVGGFMAGIVFWRVTMPRQQASPT